MVLSPGNSHEIHKVCVAGIPIAYLTHCPTPTRLPVNP